MSAIWSILIGIILFSFLIFVHELGHFIAAKASGVQVNEFAMFMGPAIFKKQGKETLYTIRCIPLGGYCAMEGEDEDTDNPRSFQKAAWWKRLIILVAGAFMNFVVGILLFIIIAMPAKQLATPVVGFVTPCVETSAGDHLQVGDRIVSVDGEKLYVPADFSTIVNINGGRTHEVVVIRDGEKLTFSNLTAHDCKDSEGNDVVHFGFGWEYEKATFFKKLGYGWNMTVDNIRNVRLSFQMLFTGKAGFNDLMGPVGIVDTMTDVAAQSPTVMDAVMNLLYFGAFIAVNLGVMNLLPIPALDGGRVVGLLLTTAIEGITKKKLDSKYEGYVHGIGMLLLLGLMAVILFKDVFAIFKG